MGITITGLIIAAAITILDKSIEKFKTQGKWLRRTWLVLVLGSLGISVYGAYKENTGNTSRDAAIAILTSKVGGLPDNSSDFKQIENGLSLLLVHAGIKDAGGLPLSPANVAASPRFFVRIAADTSKGRLQPYLTNLQHRFGMESGAAILDPNPGSRLFKLVWGQHLDQVTASQRARAADALGLPPAGQPAQIEREN